MIVEELRKEAERLKSLRHSVAKSRNRHREIDSTFVSFSRKIQSLADRVEVLQESCDTNMILFESLIDMYERGHICINRASSDDIKNFAKDLFGNMRSLIATYEEAKGVSVADATIR